MKKKMKAEVFDILVGELSGFSLESDSVQAARAVLVDGLKGKEAAVHYNVSEPIISKRKKALEQKLKAALHVAQLCNDPA